MKQCLWLEHSAAQCASDEGILSIGQRSITKDTHGSSLSSVGATSGASLPAWPGRDKSIIGRASTGLRSCRIVPSLEGRRASLEGRHSRGLTRVLQVERDGVGLIMELCACSREPEAPAAAKPAGQD